MHNEEPVRAGGRAFSVRSCARVLASVCASVPSVLFLCVLVAVGGACGAHRPPAAAAPTPAQRLSSADALVREGCLECLIDAYGEYDLLRSFPYARDAATTGAVRAPA